MEHKCSRKFNTDFRKKFISKFDKLKNKNDYIDIYNIIVEDISTNFSSNRNGIFININILSDDCIDKLIEFMDDKLNLTQTLTENEKNNYKNYKINNIELFLETDRKIINQKNIIRPL